MLNKIVFKYKSIKMHVYIYNNICNKNVNNLFFNLKQESLDIQFSISRLSYYIE